MRRVLVANRGEIAARIFRTCRGLGLATVAVHTADDRGSLHVRDADDAREVASYLDVEALIEAARVSGADTVHPGYGFLAESPALAEAVVTAGLTWVGPPAGVIALGGDKLASKEHAVAAGVPVLPSGTPEELGFPLIVKAAAGGGGRGMRVVRSPDALDDAVAAARREAQAAFADGAVFLERYVDRPRHVEVQLLADSHGRVVALGERECSIQRRHQKVLEEAPSPGIDDDTRAAILEAAVAFARQIGYVGAGTAEFMVAGTEFFFLELNARIQVEHPVTEAVTGLDIVAEQLRIAQGLPLELSVATPVEGHAIEVRLCAEDPLTFVPQVGRIDELSLPDGVRVDAGVEQGDTVGTRFDPLLAKLIAHGDTREAALALLERALASTVVRGVRTNLPLLRWLVAHPVVRRGETTTGFLDDHPPLSRRPRRPATPWREPFRLNLPAVETLPPPRETATAREIAADDAVVAPMAGTVIAVDVEVGETVQKHQRLVVLEAMKMEMPVAALHEAVVEAVHVAAGAIVSEGELLVTLAPSPAVDDGP